MKSVRLEPELEAALDAAADATGHTRFGDHSREALDGIVASC